MNSIKATNINPSTSKAEVENFFSFCGKIEDIQLKTEQDGTQTAEIRFAKDTSAGTAALLNDTVLNKNKISITKLSTESTASSSSPSEERSYNSEREVPQEDKPRRRVVAELLAHGYAIGDRTIAQALELDKTHGISARFEQWLKALEDRFKPQERARELDTKYDLSGQAAGFIESWRTYFEDQIESASKTPIGIRLRGFYDDTVKTVQSVHEEAQFIKNKRYAQTCNCGASASSCTCAPGTCACSKCPKNLHTSSEGAKSGSAEACCADPSACSKEKGCAKSGSCGCDKLNTACSCPEGQCACPKKTGKDCGCNSVASDCPCPKGQCACPGCGNNTSDCGCGLAASKCVCPKGQCECAGCERKD